MDADYLQEIYLHLLYGVLFEDFSSSQELQYLQHNIDQERLAIESRLRINQLKNYINTEASILNKYVDNIDIHIDSYVDSKNFLKPKGRTLIEDFSMFVFNTEQAKLDEQLKIICRIQGICSSFRNGLFDHTPWKEHSIVNDKSVVEAFNSKYKVFVEDIFMNEKIKKFENIESCLVCIVYNKNNLSIKCLT